MSAADRPALPDARPAPLRRTVLFGRHAGLEAKMVAFAGWELPLEYPGGIFREHAAVRSAAGLFDVSHMGIWEVRGKGAGAFLEAALASPVALLKPGRAQYGYVLGPDGVALDDLYVYCLAEDCFLLVVNAANSDRDGGHLRAALAGEFGDWAPRGEAGRVALRDLRDAGNDSKVLLALQGPAAAEVLCTLVANEGQRVGIRASRLNDFLRADAAGLPVFVAHTGYTGEETAFELFVHPVRVRELWDLLLDVGRPKGLQPCGLGARDSLRIEAGLPLFGHELEGAADLTLTEAGYGFALRNGPPPFVGQEAYQRRVSPRRKRLLRLKGQGRRALRPGHTILDEAGKAAGVVTSFAFCDADFTFHALAAVRADFQPRAGMAVRGARCAPEAAAQAVDETQVVTLTVLPRFPTAEEKALWRAQYGKRATTA